MPVPLKIETYSVRKMGRILSGKTPVARVTRSLVEFAQESPARAYLRKVQLPLRTCGEYRVQSYMVSLFDAHLFNLNEAFRARRFIAPGEYTSLTQRDQLWMTDTPAEQIDHIEVVDHAYFYGGYVLILGLGLGMVVQAVLDMPQVAGCTVVDISSDVIKLVAPTYKRRYGKRFQAVCADALTWKPDHLYSAVWADIWPTLSPVNLPEVAKLKRRYKNHGWFGAWGVKTIRAQSREEAAEIRQLRSLAARDNS